jgi:hypothetical protein
MGMTTFGRSGLALRIIGSSSSPDFLALGSGSGTYVSTTAKLYGEVFSNNRQFYSTRDITTQNEVTWTWDKSSVAMSGINLREYGVVSTSGNEGTIWFGEGFNAITFDGSNELQIQITFRIF